MTTATPRLEPGQLARSVPGQDCPGSLPGLVRHRWSQSRLALLLVLVGAMPLVSGCGLGWLYMRAADSNRIKATKLLTYDASDDRFDKADELLKSAIKNYRDESLLYDDVKNPEVYHKLGFTFLMLRTPDLGAAEGAFRNGVKKKNDFFDEKYKLPEAEKKRRDEQRAKQQKEGHTGITAEAVEVDIESSLERRTEPHADEDYAMMNSGLGIVAFLNGVRELDEGKQVEFFKLAEARFKLAEKYTNHPNYFRREATFWMKALSWLDLDEVSMPTPHLVLSARLFHYKARLQIERGHRELASHELQSAQDALDSSKPWYEKEPRWLAESAYHHYLTVSGDDLVFGEDKEGEKRGVHDKALSCIKQIEEAKLSQGHADRVVVGALKARIQLAIGDAVNARNTINDLVELDPTNPNSYLLRCAINVVESQATAVNSVGADMAKVFSGDEVSIVKPPRGSGPVVKDETDGYRSRIAQNSEAKSAAKTTATLEKILAEKRKENDHDIRLLMTAGDIYTRLGNDWIERAKNYYLRAFYADPKNVKAAYKLGKIYQRLNDNSGMRDCFERVCKIDTTSSFCREVRAVLN